MDIISKIREALHYSGETGILTWRSKVSDKVVIGAPAGTRNYSGYILISVFGRRYRAHRLAWAIVHGSWPTLEIDHINGDRSDNRLENLREATRAENSRNARGKRGYLKGATYNKKAGRWQAQIMKDGRTTFLGHYDTPEQAHEAYKQNARNFHGEFARPS